MDLHTISHISRPRSREEIQSWRTGDAWLGGGTWLFSEPQPALKRLIDLGTLGWPSLTVTAHGLEIAATCTIAQLNAASLPSAWAAAPLIGQCCRALLASFKIWNMATVGGNICMSLPAGAMIALTAALDGVCTIWRADGRVERLPVIQFVHGPQQNALAPGDLLRSVFLPAAALQRRTALRKASLNPLGRSAALLIGTRAASGGPLALTVTGATRRPVQIVFSGAPTPAEVDARIAALIPDPLYYDDIHGNPAWRRHLTFLFAQDLRDELCGGGA